MLSDIYKKYVLLVILIHFILTNTFTQNVWTKTYGGCCSDWALSVDKATDGGYFIVGTTESFDTAGFDIWMIKTDPLGNIDEFISPAINNDYNLPRYYYLYQNYPNPFNSKTNITYSLAQADYVTLKVYNMLGQEVETLVNQFQKAGRYFIIFDACNLSSGIYFYKLQIGDHFSEIKKMLYLR